MTRDDAYIAEARQAAIQLWQSLHALRRLQDEWNAADFGTTLADGTGANAGYTRAEVGAVVFATTDALFAVLAAGSATNIARLL